MRHFISCDSTSLPDPPRKMGGDIAPNPESRILNPEPQGSTALLDTFRRDRARGINDDIDLRLRPAYRDLLVKLGNPHEKLPPVFHVAGTNGKGSTCAFLRSMLEAAGRRVHVYTSPHLVRFHERIRIAGKLIEESELAELLELCRNLSAPGEVTYFEAATAVAFAAFARHPADVTILEVGLGGRLDATNIIPKPIASLITRLSFDHRDYLGSTMAAIAREKAGIMRPDVPCFAAWQAEDEARHMLRSEAARIGAPLSIAGEGWRIEKTAHGFCYRDAMHDFDLPAPALPGEHQVDNAGLAMAALMGVRGSGFGVRGKEIAEGLRNVEWPARLQKLTRGNLAAMLPPGAELWLDGGHNDSAGEALARQAEIWAAGDGKKLHLVCGMLATKNPGEFLAPLSPYGASLHSVAIPNEISSLSAEDLAASARTAGMKNVQVAADVDDALRAIAACDASARILICGSLYLAGKILELCQKN